MERPAISPPSEGTLVGGHLLALVVSHANAPVGVREHVALDGRRRVLLQERALAARVGITGVLSYSTCLRTEVYALAEDAERGMAVLERLLLEVTGAPGEVLDFARRLSGSEAVHHLFRVAAGLDSAMTGEQEILGQVRMAHRTAGTTAITGPIVHRLFECALGAGARVRRETALGRGPATLGYAAALAAGAPGPEDTRRCALVLGAGRIARQAASHLRALGWRRLAIANRSFDRAARLAARVGGVPFALEELDSLLAESAVVVAATTARSPLVDAARLRAIARLPRAAGAGRSGSSSSAASAPPPAVPRVLVDLGNPRNIDPDVTTLPGLTLLDLDDLGDVAREQGTANAGAIAEAELMVRHEQLRFMGWWNHRSLLPFIQTLRVTVRAAAEREMERALQEGEVTDHEVRRRLTDSFVNRLLYEPLTRLKVIATTDPARVAMLAELASLFEMANPMGEEKRALDGLVAPTIATTDPRSHVIESPLLPAGTVR